MIEPDAKGSPITILMAEDDPDDRFALKEAFRDIVKGEVQLQFVEDGAELMEVLTRRRTPSDSGPPPLPHLILLDLNMPRKDGRQALLEIKSSPALKQIPVVIWTTSTARKDIDYCYESGASSYIVKPLGYTQLVETLGTFCRYWFQQVSLPPERT